MVGQLFGTHALTQSPLSYFRFEPDEKFALEKSEHCLSAHLFKRIIKISMPVFKNF